MPLVEAFALNWFASASIADRYPITADLGSWGQENHLPFELGRTIQKFRIVQVALWVRSATANSNASLKVNGCLNSVEMSMNRRAIWMTSSVPLVVGGIGLVLDSVAM